MYVCMLMRVPDFNEYPMRLPNTEHTSRPWRIHELTPDFRVEDVWALATPGGRDDLPLLVEAIAAGDPSQSRSRATRTLWAIRWKLGELFGWDGPDAGLGSRVVNFTSTPNPLQPGRYRFQTLSGLTDRAGNTVPTFTRDFVVANPPAGIIENTSNDTIPGATLLPMTESPGGSGFLTALGAGSLFTTADRDYWPPAHRELLLTLDDVLIEDGKIAPFGRGETTYAAMGRFGNLMLVGGESDLSLSAQHGEVVRFYLTNTANTRVFNVQLPGARMKLVGGDSGRCEREELVD